MTISHTGIQLIKVFEGFRSRMYPDADGWSIGYGYYLGPRNEAKQTPVQRQLIARYKDAEISRTDAHELMMERVREVEASINRLLITAVPAVSNLAQHQVDGLGSFIYNVGTEQFLSSTLAKLVAQRRFDHAVWEFPKWKWVTRNGKKVVDGGLLARRKVEAELFAGRPINF